MAERRGAGRQPSVAVEPTWGAVGGLLEDALLQFDDLVAVFGWPGGEVLWTNRRVDGGPAPSPANESVSRAAPDESGDLVPLMARLDEWSQAHFLVRAVPMLARIGRWEGNLGLHGLGRPPSFASTHVSARIVAHFDAAGSIDALTLFAHPTAESTTDETGTQHRDAKRDAQSDASGLLAVLVDGSGDVVLIVEPDGTVKRANAAAVDGLGLGPADSPTTLHGNLLELVHPEDRSAAELAVAGGPPERDAAAQPPVRLRLRDLDGVWRSLDVTATDLTENPSVQGIVFSGRDITSVVESELDLVERVFFDELTGLPNRLHLLDHFDALTEASSGDGSFALLLVDLDHLKPVNTRLGSSTVDAFLVAFARRLVTIMDGPRDGVDADAVTIARLRSDEFAVLLPEAASIQRAVDIAQDLRHALRQPFDVDGQSLSMTTSIGVATCRTGEPFDALLTHADRALGQAKHDGRDRVVAYDGPAARREDRRQYLDVQLRRALDADTLQLGYQPIIDLERGEVVGAEALLRIRGAKGELLNPTAFVEAAESNGLISGVGLAVLRSACEQIGDRPGLTEGASPLEISVNVSPRQIASPEFASHVEAVLADTGVDPGRLLLEITEGALGLRGAVDTNIVQLRDLGVIIGLDEFGSANSSVGALRRYPIDFVKLDRQLIDGVGTKFVDDMIVRSTIDLAHQLDLFVVAVGVEKDSQLEHLRQLSCDRVQGFLFAPDLQPDALATFVTRPPQ